MNSEGHTQKEDGKVAALSEKEGSSGQGRRMTKRSGQWGNWQIHYINTWNCNVMKKYNIKDWGRKIIKVHKYILKHNVQFYNHSL